MHIVEFTENDQVIHIDKYIGFVGINTYSYMNCKVVFDDCNLMSIDINPIINSEYPLCIELYDTTLSFIDIITISNHEVHLFSSTVELALIGCKNPFTIVECESSIDHMIIYDQYVIDLLPHDEIKTIYALALYENDEQDVDNTTLRSFEGDLLNFVYEDYVIFPQTMKCFKSSGRKLLDIPQHLKEEIVTAICKKLI